MNLIGHEESRHIFCNQLEFNPFLNRKELVDFCQKNNIRVVAYGSLYKITDTIIDIANSYKKTPYQVLLRWANQKRIHVIPMSEKEEYTIDNINIFDFEISREYMNRLDNLNENFSKYPKYLD